MPTHLVVKTSNSWIIQTIHQTRVPIGKAGEWLNGPCLQGNSDGSTSPHARQCDVDLGTAVGFPASSSGTCGPATGRLDRAGSTLIKRCAWRRGQRRGDRQSTEFRRSGRWPRNHHLGITRTNPVSMAKAWDEPGSTPGVEPPTTSPHRVLPAAESRRPDQLDDPLPDAETVRIGQRSA